MTTREEKKLKKIRIQQEEDKKRKEAISKRKSITVKAKELGIPRDTYLQMLIEKGRLEESHMPTEKYKQYEHPTQTGQGYSYDPEFFEGVE